MEIRSEFSRRHPVVNLIYLVSVILVTILTMHPFMLLISFSGSLIYAGMLAGGRTLRKNLIIFIPICIFTVLIQPLFSGSGSTPLFYINDNAVTAEAYIYGAFICMLLVSTIQWFTCWNELINTEKLMYLTGRLSPSIGLVISMTFRLIPLLRHRFSVIEEGQAAMGLKNKDRGIVKRGQLLIKELSILTAWSLEASIETSDSMEARGYGLRPRTSFNRFRFQWKDCVWISWILCITALCIRGIVENATGIFYFPVFAMPKVGDTGIITFTAYAVLVVSPVIYDLGGRFRWQRLSSEM